MSGRLIVEGTLSTEQFWPTGLSDADTTKVLVQPNGFHYQTSPTSLLRETSIFDTAVVRGEGTKPAIHNGKVTIRLQGIDAPELHYRPSPLSKTEKANPSAANFKELNKEYRQLLGESAAVALHDLLTGSAILKCRVETRVDHPNEVFDKYGRMVGDVVVHFGDKDLNLNQWLLEQGWAVPTFYDSMQTDEIVGCLKLGTRGQKHKNRPASKLALTISKFNFALKTRPKGSIPDPVADLGPSLMPKLFRRQANWACRRKAGVFTGNFAKFLNQHPDSLRLTKEFLEFGATAKNHSLSDFLVRGKFNLRPEDMVFQEGQSTLLDKDGNKIEHWFATGDGE